jgi:hypothetical protein
MPRAVQVQVQHLLEALLQLQVFPFLEALLYRLIR